MIPALLAAAAFSDTDPSAPPGPSGACPNGCWRHAGGLDTIFGKVAELNRHLEAKRAELKEEQRRNRWPPVATVKSRTSWWL